MRIAATLTATVAAAVCLVGLSGLSTVAHAAEPNTATVVTTGADMSINASRHFTVKNSSSHTFVVQKVFFATGGSTSGSLPEDSYPATGTVLGPGQSLGFEVQAWADHNVNVILNDTSARGLVVAYLHVSGGYTYPSAVNSAGAAFQLTPQPSVGGLTISDADR
ncbi:MAG TPA: hypothetical protein VFT68_19185 [Lapillicoccus sp.]|nr:hypothetical protein [Lapillicoccus sp.]